MIGIYGGTFDPIHYGHLRTALEVKSQVGLDEVRFLPCREPPHRGVPGAPPEQRLLMLELALADAEPGFVIDPRELNRPGPSYMVDTLASLRADLGAKPLCLIVGLDAFRGFPRWHRWEALFELAHVLVMQRPGNAPDLPPELAEITRQRQVATPAELAKKSAGGIYFLSVTQLEISATAIRELIRSGKSARYLLPNMVLRWIGETRLYQG